MTLEALLLALRNIILQDPAAAQKELQDIPAFDALIVEDRRWCRTQRVPGCSCAVCRTLST